jgi:UDPglucose--hexose-1-phosphate uridylyltransferase
MFDIAQDPHKRLNILTGEWVLVSPHRNKRPWQGKVESVSAAQRPAYDQNCYLCPSNKRSEGSVNPAYHTVYAFTNDFSAVLQNTSDGVYNEKDLLHAVGQRGICRVICFSPRHDLTLPELDLSQIEQVIDLWQEEFQTLSAQSWIKYIQIFENKGEIMGCSNPHPHGQIWSLSDIPVEIEKESKQQLAYYKKSGRSILLDYLEIELNKKERLVYSNNHFVALVPFWATWPYETMIISRRHIRHLLEFSSEEKTALADILQQLTIKYDNLFETSFPYSAGMHQSPVNDGDHEEWHWHMHFYPPLLRSATVKKFMVGYELLAGPQRDITPESAAEKLRNLSSIHYKRK